MTGPDRALRLIATPAGLPGSGRLRYGAAMTLCAAGMIDGATLEVFRVLAMLDDEDPAALLAARGLPPPPPARPDRASRLDDLADEIDALLAPLGLGEVPRLRRALARARQAARRWSHGPAARPSSPPPEAVLRHLGAALDGAAAPGLAAALAVAAADLDWRVYGSYDPAAIGPDFPRGHGFATLLGPGAPLPDAEVEIGLFLMAPGLVYPDHAHRAAELYLPVTGPHGWRFHPGRPFAPKPALAPVWNPPGRPHAMQVGAVPFLCVYGWTGDIAAPAWVVGAGQ